MSMTVRSAMSFLAVLASLPQGQAIAQPSTQYVWITGHLEDFINTTYSHDAIYRMLDVIDRYDIPAEPGFAALLIKSIREDPQVPGLYEMIERMVSEQGLRFHWHTEETHGPPPTLAEDYFNYYFADEFGNPTTENGFLIYGMDWDTAVQTILDRYTHGIDPYTGYSLPGESGGPLLFQEYFGILPSSQTTHGVNAAPAEVAMNLIVPGAMRIKT